MTVVVVSGLPGSGKTTLAESLAVELGWPLLSRDRLKERLADRSAAARGGSHGERSRRLGLAAQALLLALVPDLPRVVVEAFFHPGVAEPELLALGRPLVQVHCDCGASVARQRFERRSRDGTRHEVHHAFDDWDRFEGAGSVLALAPLVRVDNSVPVEVAAVAVRVRGLADG